MGKTLVALGLTAVILFAGSAFAADQIRARSKDHTRTNYQTGTQDRTRSRDQQKSQTKDQTQNRDRLKDGSCNTTK